MGDILGAIGQIITTGDTAGAVKSAGKIQQQALQQVYQNILSQMDPAQVQQLAEKAASQYTNSALGLQRQIDPALYGTRFSTEGGINGALQDFSNPLSNTARVKAASIGDALAGNPALDRGVNTLTGQASDLLRQGGSIPSDIQAELTQKALEQGSAATGGNININGMTGVVLRRVLANASTALQQQRQQQASGMLASAGTMNTQQQDILSRLFPTLAQTQLQTIAAPESVLTQSNALMPSSGLGGSDIANIWLGRLGASNQLLQNKAQNKAAGEMAYTQANNDQIGAYTNLASSIVKEVASLGMGGGGGIGGAVNGGGWSFGNIGTNLGNSFSSGQAAGGKGIMGMLGGVMGGAGK